MSNSIRPVGYNVSFTHEPSSRATQFCLSHATHFVEIGGAYSVKCVKQLQLSVVHAFCDYMQDTLDSHRGQRVVVCPEDSSQASVATACLLCGAYLLLCESREMTHVLNTFQYSFEWIDTVSEEGNDYSTSIIGSWRALDRARALHWLGYADDVSEPMLDVDMAVHYARPSNGNVHVLVPDKLLLFPAPASLPDGQEWAQASASRPTARVFSAGFLADLLLDLGVSAVACVGQADGRDAAAFAARGLDVHDLGIDPRRPALLRAVDRLVAVSRASPGAVALFGGDGDGLPEPVGTLVAAYLMVELGFCASAAAAWIRMLCPALDVEHASLLCDLA